MIRVVSKIIEKSINYRGICGLRVLNLFFWTVLVGPFVAPSVSVAPVDLLFLKLALSDAIIKARHYNNRPLSIDFSQRDYLVLKLRMR